MAEPTGVQHDAPTGGRGRVWRHRPTISGLVAVAALALLAPLATTGSNTAPAEFREPADSSVTLSMAVSPGEAVPMALVREAGWHEFDGQGATGQGIDVAIIDSGVSPVAGLHQPGKVLYGPDLSNEGGLANLANLDTFGHGTHLAGIIAGDDGDQLLGIAPSSRIVSLKVAGATGETDVAQVIAAIDWVVEHRNADGLNIRVLNLSLGVPSIGGHVGDPLAVAVERAWKAGIVVVAAAGNRGHAAGSVDSPAINPFVLAVGSTEKYDVWGTNERIAEFTSGGNTARQADVLAPGKSIMSLRVPGSFLDSTYPTARVGERYFRGSGTSQSAAVASGYAAALLSRDPWMTPDQVKYTFMRSADDMDRNGYVDGAGRIDANNLGKRASQAWRAGAQHHLSAAPAGALDLLDPSSASWSGGEWNGASWSGGTWSGASWAGASWAGASWAAGEWAGASWAGASWAGASWAGASWTGASWAGASWAGASWAGASWAGEAWQ